MCDLHGLYVDFRDLKEKVREGLHGGCSEGGGGAGVQRQRGDWVDEGGVPRGEAGQGRYVVINGGLRGEGRNTKANSINSSRLVRSTCTYYSQHLHNSNPFKSAR